MAKIQKRLLEKKEGKYTERKKIDLKNTDMTSIYWKKLLNVHYESQTTHGITREGHKK